MSAFGFVSGSCALFAGLVAGSLRRTFHELLPRCRSLQQPSTISPQAHDRSKSFHSNIAWENAKGEQHALHAAMVSLSIELSLRRSPGSR